MIAVIGAGAMGTALGMQLSGSNPDTVLLATQWDSAVVDAGAEPNGCVRRVTRRGGVPLEQGMLSLGVQGGGRLVQHQEERIIAHEAPRQRQQPADCGLRNRFGGGTRRRRQADTLRQESTENRMIDTGVRQVHPAQARGPQRATEEAAREAGIVFEISGETGELDAFERGLVEALRPVSG